MSVARRSREAGFTLLEVLTVLVIGGLLIALLQQAFSVAVRSSERVAAVADAGARAMLRDLWLRQVLVTTTAGEIGDPPALQGEANRLAGRTRSPLFGGVVADYVLEIRERAGAEDTLLVYREGDSEVVLWTLARGSRFAYLDERRAAHGRWPKPPTPAGTERPLPAWIAIVNARSELSFVAALERAETRRPAGTPFSLGVQP